MFIESSYRSVKSNCPLLVASHAVTTQAWSDQTGEVEGVLAGYGEVVVSRGSLVSHCGYFTAGGLEGSGELAEQFGDPVAL